MKNRRNLLLSFLIISILVSSAAAEEKKDVWQPTTPGPFTTFTAPLCEKGKVNIQPLYFFNITRGTFDDTTAYHSLPSKDYKYQQLLQLYTQFGLADHIEVCAQPSWQWNYRRKDGETAGANGIGDTLLIARYCGIEETEWIPRATGLFQVKLPTGKYQKSRDGKIGTDITGTGSTDYTYGVSFTKGVYPIRTLFHLDLLYTNIPTPVRIDGIKTKFSDIYTVNGAFEWIFYKNFNLLGELVWQSQGDKKQDQDKSPATDQGSLTFATGIGYSRENCSVLIGYQRTLLGTNVDANDTVAATVIITF